MKALRSLLDRLITFLDLPHRHRPVWIRARSGPRIELAFSDPRLKVECIERCVLGCAICRRSLLPGEYTEQAEYDHRPDLEERL